MHFHSVGNIPFEYTEEQLIDLFKAAGPVRSFNLIFDRETSKPKGFGFCEFYDVDTASSAVRNLGDYELGNRKLRVDFVDPAVQHRYGADTHSGGDSQTHDDYNPGQGQDPPLVANPILSYRNLVATDPNISSTDAISKTLASMSQDQLYELLSHVQYLSTHQPGHATALLNSNPQLTYAVFQAMLMLNLIDAAAVQPAATAPPPVGQVPDPVALQQQQQMMLAQLIALPQHEIDRLPESERQKIMQIRAQLAAVQGQVPTV
ncbi:hypothetical protein H4R33_001321 [Dimargaris cristalligena]|nr:hypothetical protein H4R33_001321 [Dimargaris cristalligena]